MNSKFMDKKKEFCGNYMIIFKTKKRLNPGPVLANRTITQSRV